MSDWNLVSAEVQGASHSRKGVPCQDKTFTLLANRVRVIALADGAGSAKLSHHGASAITQRIAHCVADSFDLLVKMPEVEIKRNIIAQIRETLDLLSQEMNCDTQDLSSTLLLVAVKKDKYLLLHIGDGVIGCLRRDSLAVLSEPENGEFSNQTWFTTANNIDRALRVDVGDASVISGFILMSDGVEPSLYDCAENELARAVINLMYVNAKTPPSQMQPMLAESLQNVISKRTGDDCSIALLSRTRYKNFNEYRKYLRQVARRQRKTG